MNLEHLYTSKSLVYNNYCLIPDLDQNVLYVLVQLKYQDLKCCVCSRYSCIQSKLFSMFEFVFCFILSSPLKVTWLNYMHEECQCNNWSKYIFQLHKFFSNLLFQTFAHVLPSSSSLALLLTLGNSLLHVLPFPMQSCSCTKANCLWNQKS